MESKRTKLGHQFGVLFCLAGFVLVWVGWNGAASYDSGIRQFPYLISGGIAGLCFVVLGVGMLVVQNQRADRAALQATLRELQESLERAGLAQGTGEARKQFAKPAPRPTPPPTHESSDGHHDADEPTRAVELERDDDDLETVGAAPAKRASKRTLRARKD